MSRMNVFTMLRTAFKEKKLLKAQRVSKERSLINNSIKLMHAERLQVITTIPIQTFRIHLYHIVKQQLRRRCLLYHLKIRLCLINLQ
jgi:hypothetical protein